jgi:hypothetical protein
VIITGTEPIGVGTNAVKILAPNEAPKPRTQIIGNWARMGFLTPAMALERYSGDPVAMIFPREVYLTTQERETILYPAGRHDVPEELADHPYLRANDATRLMAAEVRELQPTQSGSAQKTAPLPK